MNVVFRQIYIFIGLSFLFGFAFSHAAYAMGERPQPCPSGTIYLQAGNVIFHLPVDTRGLYARNGSIGDSDADIHRFSCDMQHPTQVSAFSFFPGKEFPKLKPDADGNIHSSSMQIEVHYNPNYRPVDSYVLLKKNAEFTDAMQKGLPLKEGYYFWKSSNSTSTYISANGLKTPDGNPVVFGCAAQTKILDLCATQYIKGQIVIEVSIINSLYLPIRYWEEFYRLFITYVNGLIAKNNTP